MEYVASKLSKKIGRDFKYFTTELYYPEEVDLKSDNNKYKFVLGEYRAFIDTLAIEEIKSLVGDVNLIAPKYSSMISHLYNQRGYFSFLDNFHRKGCNKGLIVSSYKELTEDFNNNLSEVWSIEGLLCNTIFLYDLNKLDIEAYINKLGIVEVESDVGQTDFFDAIK
jgi:hypothetical protein